MRNFRHKARNAGYTMPEVLAAVAVLVILLTLSMVGVGHYMHTLKITELDNAAREIYMAAQNRATLLANGGRLENVLLEDVYGSAPVTVSLSDAETAEGMCTSSVNSFAIYDLLPEGCIDQTLRDHYFYICYEPKSGSVTDVFYAESPMDPLTGSGMQGFYDQWHAASVSDRIDAEPMLGHYSGGSAKADEFGAPSSPSIAVFIENGEELTATVVCQAPGTVPDNVERKVVLRYEDPAHKQYTVDLMQVGGSRTAEEPPKPADGVNATIYTRTWVLDSLNSGKQFRGLPFRDASGGSAEPTGFGCKFTVWAEVSSKDGSFGTAEDEDTANSLFADYGGSDGILANVENLRHLQNLDPSFSGVKGKKEAEQLADISCWSNETYPKYVFQPIENDELTEYNGANREIRDLRVEKAAASGAAGLFGTATAASGAPKPMVLRGVRLINATVKVSAGTTVGTLVGRAENAEFTDCRVYWEPEEGEQDLRSLLGSDEAIDYVIAGETAGGLAGSVSGEIEVVSCFAATLVNGNSAAGGLFGAAESGADVSVENSYADCYLTGKGKAAGLVGSTAGRVALKNVYAAGFIDMGNLSGGAAGFCLGSGDTEAQNAYSVMSFRNVKDTGKRKHLTENAADDLSTSNHVYYLGDNGLSYGYMSGTADGTAGSGDFASVLGAGFGWKSAKVSKPYNLQTILGLTAYSFPGLKSLPHYGDWGARFSEPSLVYYELYKNGTYGFSGGNERYLIGALSDTDIIEEDGYAVALLANDLDGNNSITSKRADITYYWFDGDKVAQVGKKLTYYAPDKGTWNSLKLKETTWKNAEGEKVNYYLAVLPEELVQNLKEAGAGKLTATEDFYQYLKFELLLGGDASHYESSVGEYFYNPHFAETVKPYVAEADSGTSGENGGTVSPGATAWDADSISKYAGGLIDANRTVSVRTPRHLFNLSLAPEYAHNVKYPLTFAQRLELDYSTYTGYKLFAEVDYKENVFIQEPIGSLNEPFNAVYNGGSQRITGVGFRLHGESAGLFGNSSGTLRNIVYQMTNVKNLSIGLDNFGTIYIGGLAGRSSGQIENCAVYGVRITGSGTQKSYLYIGGLVGENRGTIRSCTAECVNLAANSNYATSAYIGGLVGSNTATGSVSLSYAVGRATATVDNDTSRAKICGFVGMNRGSIASSYAAVSLISSGKTVEAYGFCGEAAGRQSGNVCLNEGNFTYREESYAAVYELAKAKGARYEHLKGGKENAAPLISAGMHHAEDGVRAVYDDLAMNASAPYKYPYPAVIRDKSGAYVHYGQWPEAMTLGDMGVYYWEKLDVDGSETWHVSLLAADVNGYQISRQSTLSTAHTDGGVIEEYGYGYYYTTPATDENGNVSPDAPKVWLESEEILYAKDGKEKGAEWKETAQFPEEIDADAKAALETLMQGYTFCPYRSFGLTEDGGGMYPVKFPNGTVTLKQKAKDSKGKEFTVSADFRMNPHFADALSYQAPGRGEWYKTKWTPNNDVPQTEPGEKETHPYEIRAVSQLQNINWNENRSTDTVIVLNTNRTEFPYLCYSAQSGSGHTLRQYFWEQTHDLNGKGETFTPIAEYYDTTTKDISNEKGFLHGWFGGTFNGGDYVIENINIKGGTTGPSSVAGLFGVVYNGKLKNIILYSSDGKGKVTACHYSGANNTDPTTSMWYAIGPLAGVAAMDPPIDSQGNITGDGGNAIENCAAAGYTVVADVYTPSGGWGGSCIGGLVGISNMALQRCTAVTNINVPSSAKDNDNMRIGGLVGTAQQTITNCYAGGTISVHEDAVIADGCAMYIGGIVGGSYIKPLQIGNDTKNLKTIGFMYDYGAQNVTGTKGWTSNELRNCYSFTTLPPAKTHDRISALYALGGTGDIPPEKGDKRNHGACTIRNCYYLDSVTPNYDDIGKRDVKSDIRGEPGYFNNKLIVREVTSLNYAQLSGTSPLPDKTASIYQKLKDFGAVEKEYHGLAVPGRYSYNAGTALNGFDYPFPTILTKKEEDTDRTVRVHYGNWPMNTIVREQYGSLPIDIDLFVPTQTDENAQAGHWTELLTLANGIPEGGRWDIRANATDGILDSWESGVDKLDNASAKLTLAAKKAGTTQITLLYETGGVRYPLTVDVHVTAELAIRPADNPVNLFTNDTALLAPRFYGRNNVEIDWDIAAQIALDFTGSNVSYDGTYLSAASIEEIPGEDVPDMTEPRLKLTTRNVATDSVPVTTSLKFSYRGETYDNESTVSLCITAPKIEYDDSTGSRTATIQFIPPKPTDPDEPPREANILKVEVSRGNVQASTDYWNTVTVGSWTQASPEITVTLWMDEREHTVKVPLAPMGQTETAALSDEIPVEDAAAPGGGAASPSGAAAPEDGAASPSGAAAPEDGAASPSGAAAPEGGAVSPSGGASPEGGAASPSGAAAPETGAEQTPAKPEPAAAEAANASDSNAANPAET